MALMCLWSLSHVESHIKYSLASLASYRNKTFLNPNAYSNAEVEASIF